ncbi:MAG: lyase family protein [Actinomycetota bacterium]
MNPADHADFGLLSPASAGTAASRLTSDYQFIQAMLDVELEWTRVLADAGRVPADAVPAVEQASRADLYDAAALAERAQGGGNPVIPLLADLRAETKKHNPAAASAIHQGATSQDILDSALMLMARRTLAGIVTDLKSAAGALARQAEEHRGTITVARTLTQHSLPSTFGLKAANWLSGVAQAGVRLERVAAELPLQWGGAAGTMAALTELAKRPINAAVTTAAASEGSASPAAGSAAPNDDGGALALAARLAERLGLADPVAPWQTNRLPVTALAAALADVLAAAGKVANDVLLLSRPELGEVSEPAAEGRGGSSAMPQKQNPVLSVLIRSAALAGPGHLAQIQAAAAGAIDERPDGSWHVEWQALRQLLRLAGGAAAKLAELSEGLAVHPERMRRNLAITGELVVSERIMATVAPLLDGGSPGAGKSKVQSLVNQSLAKQGTLAQLLRDAVPAGELSDAALAELLDPTGYIGQSSELIDRITSHYAEWSHS